MPSKPENRHRHAAPTLKADKAQRERCEAAAPPDYPLVYV